MAARTSVATLEAPRPSGRPAAAQRDECCALFHRAVELVGKRWNGAILSVLLDGPLRYSKIRALVPEISDRLLSERLKELEAEELVAREVIDEHPVGVEYRLTGKGEALEPALAALKSWADVWIGGRAPAGDPASRGGSLA